MLENGFRLRLVGGETVLDDGLVGVVEAVVLQGTFAQAAGQLGAVGAGEMKHAQHFDVLLHVLGLLHVARDAVQHEEVDLRLEHVGIDALLDVLAPEFHGHVVRDEFAAAGVLDKFLPKRRPRVQGPEHISAGQVMKARDGSQNLALGAFAAAWGAEDEKGAETCGFGGVGHEFMEQASTLRFRNNLRGSGFHTLKVQPREVAAFLPQDTHPWLRRRPDRGIGGAEEQQRRHAARCR